MDSFKSGPEPAAGSLLRQIPAVDELLNRQGLRELEGRVGHRLVVEVTRKVLQSLRERISRGRLAHVSAEWLEGEILKEAEAATEFSLEPVINATGVILHTNLGRAPLAPEALAHLVQAAAGYSTWSMIWSAASAANAMSTRTGSSAGCWAPSGRWSSITTPPPSFWP
jgi:L-seryl-tRNA(Ser) seleniumtransferase